MTEGSAPGKVGSAPRAAGAVTHPRLTSLTKGAGCACKLGFAELEGVLAGLPPLADPRVVVGTATGDDAAVWRLDPPESGTERVLVATTDFFPPMVDDPVDFGRIAAANALSDLYAMGARPLFALNLVAFPRELLASGLLDRILEGVAMMATQAGVPLVGGHSVDDREPKVGLVAIGEAREGDLIRNDRARPGDLLVLTKALGTGVITTALKRRPAPLSEEPRDPALERALTAAVDSMTTLNEAASRAALRCGVRAGTDVTGFGFLGHLSRMLRASGVAGRIEAGAVPLLEGAEALAAAGNLPDGTLRNYRDLAPFVIFGAEVSEVRQLLFHDAQTSGGLLLAVPPEGVHRLTDLLNGGAVVVGKVSTGEAGQVAVE